MIAVRLFGDLFPWGRPVFPGNISGGHGFNYAHMDMDDLICPIQNPRVRSSEAIPPPT